MKNIAVLDIETTGLNHKNDLITEIGVVELCPKTGKTKIIFDSLIKEPEFGEQHRNSWIFNNSDMQFRDVIKSNHLKRHIPSIQEILNKYRLAAFNSNFDFSFLESRNFKIHNKLPCIMRAATPILKIQHYYGYKWPKVQEAWNFFFPKHEYTEKHRAADDALHEAKILFEMIRRGQYRFND